MPSLSPSRSEVSSRPSTITSRPSQRSPVKSATDLFLTTPSFDFVQPQVLSSDLAALKDIKDNIGLIPAVISVREIQREIDPNQDIRPWMLDDTDTRFKQEIRLIYRVSRYCASMTASEAAWNDGVTSCLLYLALVLENLLGHSQKRPRVERKAVAKLLQQVPNQHKLINQTLYGPVRYEPAAVNIETKTSSVSDGRSQLAVWISAWIEQMRTLKSWALSPDGKHPAHFPEPLDIQMPLIVATKDIWHLYLVKEAEDKIFVSSLFDTGNLCTCQVLEGTGCLGRWAVEEVYER
ncbi:hypothetical protein F66182_4947 [Fusarium sp. NRRL 66182]|nr:hypothetical protein F66182_4947 [Fusarium sp. NRRL 66182]